ncbi:MAG: hypothetical protein AAGA62_11600, partial [Bacteroidota bacterium]
MTYIFLDAGDHMFWAHCPWYWLWTLGAFLLGSLLTWLLTRRGGVTVDVSAIEADRDRYHGLATKWEKDYQGVKYQLEESQKAEADLRASLQRCEADKTALRFELDNAPDNTGLGIADVDTDPAAYEGGSVYAGLFSNDNFQIIEGVGPKVNKVLIDAGYKTWEEL